MSGMSSAILWRACVRQNIVVHKPQLQLVPQLHGVSFQAAFVDCILYTDETLTYCMPAKHRRFLVPLGLL